MRLFQEGEMKADPCKKCGKRFKRLTDKGLCYFCDAENWRKKYRTVKIK